MAMVSDASSLLQRSRPSSSSRPPRVRAWRGIGALDLTALGIGAIIGTGISVIIGEAIGESVALVILFGAAGAAPASSPGA